MAHPGDAYAQRLLSGPEFSYLAARLAGVRKVYVTEHLAPQKNERLEVLMQELCAFEKQVRSIARSDRRVKLLMTTPGVGAIVALTFVSAVDDPGRFSSSKRVAPSPA